MIGLCNAKTRSPVWKELGRTFLLNALDAVLGSIPNFVKL